MNAIDPYKVPVPATRGRMGSTTYYVATFPMSLVVKNFAYDPDDPSQMADIAVEDRHQRVLNKKRLPALKSYIIDNDDYIFSSITVSIEDHGVDFEPSEIHPDLGILKLPIGASWIVNDGQHRVAGIAEAMRDDPSIGKDQLSVVILPGIDIPRAQQIFADLNSHAQKTSRSLDVAFDHRSPHSRIAAACAARVLLFKNRINKEQAALSVRSADFTTLSALAEANRQLLGDLKDDTDDAEVDLLTDQAVDFWIHLTGIVEPWDDIAAGTRKPAEARANYLSSYAIALHALAAAGRTALEAGDWKALTARLSDVDWKKSSPDWRGVCMASDGKLVTRQPTRRATADYLRWKMGLGPRPAADAA